MSEPTTTNYRNSSAMSDRIKQLALSTPQGHAGMLTKESRFVFNYETGDRAAETSLTMPIRAESYASSTLHSVFAMNRPEGLVLDRIRTRLAKSMKIDDMSLLAITGRNQIGRLQYALPGAVPAPRKAQVGRKELERSGNSSELFEFLADYYFDSGISGVQPKIVMPDADRQSFPDRASLVHANLIVKSAGDEYPDLTQNEFLCMTAAKRAGIEVAEFSLSDDRRLFIMDRFDWRNETQLGFEDMAVLTGRSPNDKYEGSYENIAKVIHLFCRTNTAESLARLYEYVALSVMVRNGDAHLKNFGLVYPWPLSAEAPQLAPLYDVVTTSIYENIDTRSMRINYDTTLALKLNKKKIYPNRAELMAFGKNECNVRNPESVLEKIADAMSNTLTEFGELMSAEHGARLRKSWEEGMATAQSFTQNKTDKVPTSDGNLMP
jgi:serine/threonine-protein kinase HipA